MSEDEERERGQGQTLPPHTALQLVLSYCVHHCYAGTVRAIESSCQPPQRHGHTGDDGEGGDGDDDTVGTGKRLRGLATQWHPHDEQQRAPIVNHVLEGNVQQAMELLEQCAPGLLAKHPEVRFHLLCVRFAALVAAGDALAALQYARTHLRAFGVRRADDPSGSDQAAAYCDKLQDLVTLLAYHEPHSSPVGSFLQPEFLHFVADQVNGALLAHTQRPAQAPLERLLKHMVVTRDALAAETGTPRFNLRDHVQRHCTP